jgi:ribosomal protein S18 acetylase RimI-like enzyme
MHRAIESADADMFAGLVRRAFSDLGLDPPPSAGRITGEDVRTHLAQGGGGLIIDPAIAGLLWDQREGGLYVSRVAVDPAHRRQGLAVGLLEAAEAEAVRRGLPRIWLATRLALTGNRRLFGRLGFVETALHAHDGYAEPTFVDMEKPLRNEPLPAPRV